MKCQKHNLVDNCNWNSVVKAARTQTDDETVYGLQDQVLFKVKIMCDVLYRRNFLTGCDEVATDRQRHEDQEYSAHWQ